MNKNFVKAYTLLEQAIAISLLSVIVMMTILITDMRYDVSFYDDTKSKIEKIEQALIANIIRYSKDSTLLSGNSLPCPADIDANITSADFGLSNSMYQDVGGDCLGSYETDTSTLGNYYYGMLPVRSLGLSDDYAFDSWGRRMLYLVNKDIFQSNDVDIEVEDYTSTLFYIISYGKNGYGAYNKSGDLLDSSDAGSYELNNILSSIDIANIRDIPRSADYDDIVANKTLLQFFAELAGDTIYSSSQCSTLQSLSSVCDDENDVIKISDASCIFR